MARKLGSVPPSGCQHRLPHVHESAPGDRECGDAGLVPLQDPEGDRAAQPLPGQRRGLQVAGRKAERAAQRVDRWQARNRTQLYAIEHRRDARAYAGLARRGGARRRGHQHLDIEQCVTAQINILHPGDVGAELRVFAQPREGLLRAAGDTPGEVHGAVTAGVPLGTRRGEFKCPDLPAVDRRMNARAVPLHVRIEVVRIGPGIESRQGRVVQLHSAPELRPGTAPGQLCEVERTVPLEIRARDASGGELCGGGAERGQRART